MKPTQEIFDNTCRYGCLELTKICIEEGADIQQYGNWALRLSILYNHYKIVKFLLENGANPYNYHSGNAFWYAEYHRRTEIVSLLEQYKR